MYLKWEQEVAHFMIDIPTDITYVDVNFEGQSWRPLTFHGSTDQQYHLQVKIKPNRRSDTGLPNSSPVALFKPIYKILINKVTKISLATMDQDKDRVACAKAMFIEAGGLDFNIPGITVRKTCVIEIDASQSLGYQDGSWVGIPVMVFDYSRQNIQLLSGPTPINIRADMDELSGIPVLFLVEVVSKLDQPEFVSPTVETQHIFEIYAGSTMTIPLHAKPPPATLNTIEAFYVFSIPDRTFSVPLPQKDSIRMADGVKYTTATWATTRNDVGYYVVQARVTDNEGNEGPDRSYTIYVKESNLTETTSLPASGPYFAFFPEVSSIRCRQHATCLFPIYAASPGRNIAKISINTPGNYSIGSVEVVNHQGKHVFKSDVKVSSDIIGKENACFTAIDDAGAQKKRCLDVTLYGQDHCDSMPCNKGSTCISKDAGFKCVCASGMTGPTCETCIDDCKNTTCNHHGVCIDKHLDFTCQCFAGYSGQHCENTDSKCSPNPCKSNGVCIVTNGQHKCVCPLPFSGVQCTNDAGRIAINQPKNTQESVFTVPSFHNGLKIRCSLNTTCSLPLFFKKDSTGNLPKLTSDLKTPGLQTDVSSPVKDTVTEVSDGLTSELTITPTQPGQQKVCVQLQSSGKETDSICYSVEVPTNAVDHQIGQKSTPTFTASNPPNYSQVVCKDDVPCHVILHTKSPPFGPCLQVNSLSSAAITFPTKSGQGDCQTDVEITPTKTYGQNVCFKQLNAKEMQCFKAFKVDHNTDPCAGNACHHGGQCVNEPDTCPNFSCICQPDFTGLLCHKRIGKSSANQKVSEASRTRGLDDSIDGNAPEEPDQTG